MGSKLAANETGSAAPVCRRVLIVEDSRALQFLMTALLKSAVHEFEFASNGEEALAVIGRSVQQGNPFSMIFMDMEMPGMDGFAATQNLRQQGITIPVVAITGKTTAKDREKCFDHGCTEFLPKPVSQEELLQAVYKHCLPGNHQPPIETNL